MSTYPTAFLHTGEMDYNEFTAEMQKEEAFNPNLIGTHPVPNQRFANWLGEWDYEKHGKDSYPFIGGQRQQSNGMGYVFLRIHSNNLSQPFHTDKPGYVDILPGDLIVRESETMFRLYSLKDMIITPTGNDTFTITPKQ